MSVVIFLSICSFYLNSVDWPMTIWMWLTPYSQSISCCAFCDVDALDVEAKALGSKSAGCDSSNSFIVSVRISRQLSSKFGGSQPVFSLHIAPDKGVGILSNISWIFGTCTSQYCKLNDILCQYFVYTKRGLYGSSKSLSKFLSTQRGNLKRCYLTKCKEISSNDFF